MTDTACTDHRSESVTGSFCSLPGLARTALLVAILSSAPLGGSFAQLVKDLPKVEGQQPPLLGTDTRTMARRTGESAVTITARKNHEIREYRSGNNVYTKVIPRNAPPYYLLDEDGSGNMQWRRNSLEQSPPAKWSILKW